VFLDPEWKWADTLMPIDDDRPCARCNKPPTKEGYDACTGHMPGKTSVCCGHGVTPAISIPAAPKCVECEHADYCELPCIKG
jgi:hypothetical protein